MNRLIKNNKNEIIFEGKICPFRQPILLPNKLSGFELQAFPCANDCPHFITTNCGDNNKINLKINCGSDPVFMTADLINETNLKI
jgi:hypothetical protein